MTCSVVYPPAPVHTCDMVVDAGAWVPFELPAVSWLAIANPFVSEKSTPAAAVPLVAAQKLPKFRPFPSFGAVESAIWACLLSAKYAYQLPSVACAILSFLPLIVTVGSP